MYGQSAQYIFGGTTNRCHPKGILAPQGSYFDHTKSHWQTPDSFSRWIEKILIPDIQSTKQRLGLPTTQKAMLKIDLHYSHFEPKVLEKMQQNHILPNFVQLSLNKSTTYLSFKRTTQKFKRMQVRMNTKNDLN